MTRALFCGLVLLAGCSWATVKERSEQTPSSAQSQAVRQFAATQPTTAPAVVGTEQTPARHTSAGRVIEREVTAVRVASPFGVSPAEMLAAQKPMQVQDAPSPAVSVGPDGVAQGEQRAGATWSSGGFQRTLWDRISGFFGTIKWFLILGGAGLLALWAFPMTRPIASAILRFFAWLIPAVGGAIEAAVQRSRRLRDVAGMRDEAITSRRHFTETVKGGEEFKRAIESAMWLSAEQQQRIIEAFKTAMSGKQDKDTQDAVAVARRA